MIKEEWFYPFFQASSSEMFSNANNQNLDEKSNFGPRSPYSEAKLQNHQKTIEYWKTYNWKIYSGIMFNHESEFRGEDYLFMKIINSARLIKFKKLKKFTVGSLDYQRDWLFAGDVVKAITKIMNNGKDYNYVIGSGEANSIHNLIEIVFEYFDLKWEKYINVDPSLLRKNDPKIICSNPKKLMSELNWKNEYSFEKLVHRCITKNNSNLD